MGGPVFNATVVGNGNPGVQGNSPNGTGVEGHSGAVIPTVAGAGVVGTSPAGPGVEGRSTNGFGLRGTSSTGIAVRARSIQNGTGVYASSGTGIAVEGVGGGEGVIGRSDRGSGVYGTSSSSGLTLLPSAAVKGENFNNDGIGVYGYVGGSAAPGPQAVGVAGDVDADPPNPNGIGVRGRSFSDGTGVLGTSTNGVGVLANTTGGIAMDAITQSGTAVYGHRKDPYDPINAPDSVAGYFNGGIIAVNGPKNFQIDHPLDPQNKYLAHTCVESSEMKNVYDGVAQLDKDGAAWVGLPEWFENLNGDFRYQLTAIGGAAPNLHVAEEVSENRFKIAGGEEGMKVCWQVTGSRRDPWAAANPFQVEQQKPQEQRGRYLEPTLYDAPEEQRIVIGPITEAVEEAQRRPERSEIDRVRLEEHRRQLDELSREEDEDRRET
jgi:hypothetical protein